MQANSSYPWDKGLFPLVVIALGVFLFPVLNDKVAFWVMALTWSVTQLIAQGRGSIRQVNPITAILLVCVLTFFVKWVVDTDAARLALVLYAVLPPCVLWFWLYGKRDDASAFEISSVVGFTVLSLVTVGLAAGIKYGFLPVLEAHLPVSMLLPACLFATAIASKTEDYGWRVLGPAMVILALATGYDLNQVEGYAWLLYSGALLLYIAVVPTALAWLFKGVGRRRAPLSAEQQAKLDTFYANKAAKNEKELKAMWDAHEVRNRKEHQRQQKQEEYQRQQELEYRQQVSDQFNR